MAAAITTTSVVIKEAGDILSATGVKSELRQGARKLQMSNPLSILLRPARI